MRPAAVDFVYSPYYEGGFAGTPIDPKRADKILRALFADGLLDRRRLRWASAASMKALRRVHSDAYLESLHEPAALVPIVGYEPDDAMAERALTAQRHAAGGTLLATRRALARGRPAVNLSGGFHHAGRHAARGFCIFNDVAIAIADARRNGFEGRVLVIDLDLHDGNGTRRIFAEDESVFTFSVHNLDWDEEPAVASLSIELGDDVEYPAYLDVVREQVPALLEEVRPELVYYLAGTDPADDDPLGNWKIGAAALVERDRFVVDSVREALGDLPLVVLLAGGYGRHTWRYSARFFSWLLTGRVIEPPETADVTLARLRSMAELLGAERRAEEKREKKKAKRSGDDLWSLSEEDIYGSLGEVGRRTRLFDHFSRHGLELVLERSGLFERLRLLGFNHPTLDLDLDNPTGQTLRVFGAANHQELLIELRAARDRAAVPGFELMHLEWLLIQNPRIDFHPSRPQLPGQNHPGMGLLADVMALIVLMAEQIQLDGIVFVPSHYHLATKGRKYLRFVDPGDEAWYRAVDEAVADLSLADATRAVRDGRVRDVATDESVEWRPMKMVLPLSNGLREAIGGRNYERRVREEGARFEFRRVDT